MSDQPATRAFAPMSHLRFGACLRRAFQLYTAELGWFVAAGLFVAVVKALLAAATAGWALLLGLMIIVPVQISLYAVASAAARGERPNGDTLLEGFKRGPAYVLGLLETALLAIGLLMAILPGIVAAVALTWSTVALYRRDLAAWDAVKRSFALTRDNLGMTLGVMLVAFVLDTLGTGTVVLGAVTLPIMACLKVVVFEQISQEP